MTLAESVATGGWRNTLMVQAGPWPSWQRGILGEPRCQRRPGDRGSLASHHRRQFWQGALRPPPVEIVAGR